MGIQGDALGAHPILVFLGVVAGGLFGILGIVFVTLALAVLRVLYDFFRVRPKTDEHASTKRMSCCAGPPSW